MSSRYDLLLVSRSQDSADQLFECLTQAPDLRVEKRVITNGDSDPLRGLMTVPDLLVLHIGSGPLGRTRRHREVLAGRAATADRRRRWQ